MRSEITARDEVTRKHPPIEGSGHAAHRGRQALLDHVVGIGKIELRNRSNPVRSIAPGTDVHVTIAPDKIALVPATT